MPKKNASVKVGDIWVSVWGSGATQVDFFQVTSIGKVKLRFRPIAMQRGAIEDRGEPVRPVRGDFTGNPKGFLAKLQEDDGERWARWGSFRAMTPWDGSTLFQTDPYVV